MGIGERDVWQLLEGVYDPEIPVLSVVEMGIVRRVELGAGEVTITITPTYSGCPAMDTIAADIRGALGKTGLSITIKTVLSPAWTTAWLSEAGRNKLNNYGIAPPLTPSGDKKALLMGERVVKCPRCASTQTKMISQFGSTACKALFQCESCLEPFDYFKCI